MKKNILHRIAIAAAACALALPVLAVPAKPGILTVTQPDGTEIAVQLRGDERHHCYFTPDGFPIVSQDGYFYYAKIDQAAQRLEPTALRVNNVDMRTADETAYIASAPRQQMLTILDAQAQKNTKFSAPSRAPQRAAKGPGLFEDNNFPANGKRKAIVILVQYKDVKFTLADPYDYFSRMLMEQGFSEYDGTGSCHDFFYQNSKGQFDPEFDLFGPVTLSQKRSYYGGNDWSGNDQHPEEMVIEACNQLDDIVDFSQYDNNGDGYVDNIFVFYAGPGEANGGSSDTVWPHSWNVSSAGQYVYHDGVQIDKYGCSNEWNPSGGRPDGIGTFVHEFSHVIGLPDLYATSYTSAFTPGAYSTMDYGPYNNDGCTPPNYGAFERYALGWMEPKVLDGPANVKLKTIDNNEACIIKTSSNNEFFLFENRQQKGWDTYIPGHGMLVWHVDYDASVWSSNKVNNTPSHQYVDIEEADGKQNEYDRDGDPFPGTSNKTSFTDTTKPSMKTWSNLGLQKPITEIAENNGFITFKVCGGLPDVTGVTVTGVTDVTATSAVATWTTDENAVGYLVTCYTKVINGDRENHVVAGDWSKKEVGDVLTVTIDGLQPLTEYFVEVFSTNGTEVSPASEPVGFVTAEPTFDVTAPVATEATEVTDNSFVAHWEALEGAVEYSVDVFAVAPTGQSITDRCDFTDGVKKLPAGWISSSQSSYANAAYSGQAIPSLRLTADQAYVASPTYPEDICYISFWHRGSKVPEGNSIKVMASVNGQYVEIASVPIVNEEGGLVTRIETVPAGTRSVRIVYDAPNTGAIAIDDITIKHSLQYEVVPYLEAAPAGAELSMAVTGLQPASEYYYSVTATNGEVASLSSNLIKVVTTEKIVVEPTFDTLVPVALEATEVAEDSFVANWEAMDGAVEYFVSVFTGEDHTPVLEAASAGAELSMAVTDLQPSTVYIYSVTATDGELTSLPSEEMTVITLDKTDGLASAAVQTIKVSGKRVSIAAEPGQTVTVSDTQGRLLYRGITGSDGRLTFDLPASGIMIIRAGAQKWKIEN